MRKDRCYFVSVIAITEATDDRAISLGTEYLHRPFLDFTAGLRAITQYGMRNLESAELRVVGAFKPRGLKLKIADKIIPKGMKVNRLLISAESAKGCSCQFAKLGSSGPEGQLKGR